jgi:hypothetical protein
MNASSSARTFAGLCADCAHTERITSSHGSTFYLCRLSLTDPRFPKYPQLPVLACDGFKGNLGCGPADTMGDAR